MPVIQVDFMKSREADHQRYVRRVIRKIHRDKLTKSTRDVLLNLVNLWFYHKGGPKGYIHPSAEKIAKKVGCSIVTAKRGLGCLRDAKVITAVGYIKGGAGFATRYTVDIDAILALFDPHGVHTATGELVEFSLRQSVQNDTVENLKNDTVKGCQNDTLSIDMFQGEKNPSQEVEHG